MTDEFAFKLIVAAVFLVAVTVATTCSRGASRAHGNSLNQLQHEVPGLIPVRVALGMTFYVALFGWMLGWRALAWSFIPLPNAVRWVGATFELLALAFLCWSLISLGANFRGGAIGLYDRRNF